MCGRYVLVEHAVPLAEQFGLVADVPIAPKYNLAPTDPGLVIRLGLERKREAAQLSFGLVPWWSKDRKSAAKMINARAETVRSKPAFREAFRRRRCLIPMSGFYEWKRDATKQPFYFHAPDGRYLAAAGIYETWKSDQGILETFSMITTTANPLMAPIHDRMPVFLDGSAQESWVTPETPEDDLESLLVPAPDNVLEMWPVSRRVGSVKNDDPELIVRVEEESPFPKRMKARRKKSDTPEPETPIDQLALFKH